MDLFALSPTALSVGQFALAAILAFLGVLLLLPRSKRGSLTWGIASLIAAGAVFGIWLQTTYGNPMPDLVGSLLFWLFSLGALGFGTVLVVQRNPARGAIAFAFVILSTCGLFLLLAAPFLMAATIIIYAGAIIVTFLFVLMLSQPKGASNENDRTREPLLGSLAGFAFVGLVLFALYLSYIGKTEDGLSIPGKETHTLPAPVLTAEERKKLADVIARLEAADEHLITDKEPAGYFEPIKQSLSDIVGSSSTDEQRESVRDGSIRVRLEKVPGKVGAGAVLFREDEQCRAVLKRTEVIRKLNGVVFQNLENYPFDKKKGNLDTISAEIHRLREEVLLLYGSAELPSRNVENLGFMLYADHLLAIELAGTLLLVATIGAVAIAHKKVVPT
jgi:NADH-quinone oxidoreductase subunit J